MEWSFTANATSKEDVKAQVRGDRNRDCPDSMKQAMSTVIDALQLPAGHTIRVEMSGEKDGQRTVCDIHIETTPE
jgi:hypothetical protein